MNAERRRQINEFAVTLRAALDVKSPVDMQKIVSLLGGKIRYVEPSEIPYEAIIEKSGDSFLITLTNDKKRARHNFSIAHELGHLFLHMGYIVAPEKWQKTETYEDSIRARHGFTEEELEANEFSGALLMPRDEFISIAQKYRKDGLYQLNKIGEHFDTSSQAVKTRGQWLNVFKWD
jgi:Zn-dependent peptidase ImmA (M78 family)